MADAEIDYLLARYLFPRNQRLHTGLLGTSLHAALDLFEPFEHGHPVSLARWLFDQMEGLGWYGQDSPIERKLNYELFVHPFGALGESPEPARRG